jgi:phosphohistidine swiveling domain-containing protein
MTPPIAAFVDPRFVPVPVAPGQVQRVGGKAANLIALQEGGFAVPAFDVWPVSEWTLFLREAGITALPALDDVPGFARLEEIVRTFPFSAERCVRLEQLWRQLGPGPLCVRSSGTAEDLEDASFAGQYESVLDLTDLRGLEAAVRTCWASLLHPRVRAYFQTRSLDFQAAGIALIFQRFIRADTSGVTFTTHPLTGRDQHFLIEYCAGGADKLVSGKITPSVLVFDHRLGRPVSGTLPPGLSAKDLGEFRRIAAYFGRPQDIEWVVENGRLLIVQARPITRVEVEPSFGTWTTADFRDGGVSSTPVTPFMWSLYDYIWQFAMPRYFEIIRLLRPGQKDLPWAGVFFGRPYWNLGEVVKCLLQVPGFDEKNFFADLGIKTEADYPFRRIPFAPAILARIVPLVLSLERYYESRIRRNKAFRNRFPHLIAPFRQIPSADLPDERFARLFRRLITRAYFVTETSYFFTIYNTSNAKLDFKIHLDILNGRGHEISYLRLISGLSRMKHLQPLKEMARLAGDIAANERLRDLLIAVPSREIPVVLAADPDGLPIVQRMAEFLRHFGHHSARELDIAVPRWQDDHETVWRLLQSYLKNPDIESGVGHEKRQLAMYRREVAATRQAFSGLLDRLLPFGRRLFFRNLLRTRSYCWWREEMRDYSSRMYALIREYAVEAGRRLGLREGEVFWLTWQQTADALEGRLNASDVRASIETACEESRMFRAYRNPDELGAGLLAGDGKPPADNGNGVRGIACSPGVIEGTARVVLSLEHIDRIKRGDILVTRFTDPGWTPVFYLLGGVVTETGGVLSHAAVISREYGIPAVLNVPGITRHVPDGARVRLDGTRGTVEILAPAPGAAVI